MIAHVAAAVVGAVFVFSGLVKAVDIRSAAGDLGRYDVLPRTALVPAAILIAGLEATLGAALIVYLKADWLVPFALIITVSLAVLTAWGAYARSLEDCGCYGGIVILTPAQSIALDAVYVVLLAAAWIYPSSSSAQLWQVGVCASVAGATWAVGWMSRREALIPLARIQEGRRWNSRWLPGRDLRKGEYFVVFLSKDCPFCKRWVPLLNVMHAQTDFPDVLGIVGLSETERDDLMNEHMVRFPVERMDRAHFRRMVTGYPTAAHVEDGRIQSVWAGSMPEEYAKRIRRFFEAVHTSAGVTDRGTFAG